MSYTPKVNASGFALQSAVQALGTTISTAAELWGDLCHIKSVAAGVNDGVKLSVGFGGKPQTVINRSGGTVKVYPPSGGTICGAAADIPLSLASNSPVTFYAIGEKEYFTK